MLVLLFMNAYASLQQSKELKDSATIPVKFALAISKLFFSQVNCQDAMLRFMNSFINHPNKIDVKKTFSVLHEKVIVLCFNQKPAIMFHYRPACVALSANNDVISS